jgi:hypothetical protein
MPTSRTLSEPLSIPAHGGLSQKPLNSSLPSGQPFSQPPSPPARPLSLPTPGRPRRHHRASAALGAALLALLPPSLLCSAEPRGQTPAEPRPIVVAEGAGLTPADALKDAFREAVRQVVGAVVDAETLVENDELIKDEVLTYSDGFITSYDKVSQEVAGGLVRVTIKATVERRSIQQKLQAANITTRAVSGRSMFAEALTQAEAAESGEQLLQTALLDLRPLITAEVDGEPDFDRKTSKITVAVKTYVDANAYQRFTDRLTPVLEKIAISKHSTLVKAVPVRSNNPGRPAPPGLMEVRNHPPLAGPKVDKSQWCIWINTSHTSSHDTLRWEGYVIDGSPAKIIGSLETAFEHRDILLERGLPLDNISRPSTALLRLRVAACGSDGINYAETERELLAGRGATYDFGGGETGFKPLLRHVCGRTHDGQLENPNNGVAEAISAAKARPISANLYIAPYSFTVKKTGYGTSLYFQPTVNTREELSVSLGELANVTDIQCEVTWDSGE